MIENLATNQPNIVMKIIQVQFNIFNKWCGTSAFAQLIGFICLVSLYIKIIFICFLKQL